jgi:hypothetical protein
MTQKRRIREADLGDRSYALERANERLGHKPPSDFRTEIFIGVALLTTLWLALKDC